MNDSLKKRLLEKAAALQAQGTAAFAQSPLALRQALRGTQLKFRSETEPVSAVAGLRNTGGSVLAGVVPHNPDTINIVDQAAFNKGAPQLVAHEATHNVMNNLPGPMQDKIPADNEADPYNYGGSAGLNALRKKGGTILDLPREQQAALVQYYQSQGGANAPKGIRESHEPFVNDLAKLPQSVIQPTSPDASSIDMTPRAPRVPVDVPGALQPAKETYDKGDPAPGQEKPAAKKALNLSAGMRLKQDITKHPSGRVTAIDEESGLPIVRRSASTPAQSTKPTPQSAGASGKPAAPQIMSGKEKSLAKEAEPETKYSYGSTQANLPKESEARKAIANMQETIPEDHLAGKGKDVDEPHVTLRYGIQGDDTADLKKYLKQQPQFDAKLGKTGVFPPTKNSDGAAVVHAEVESPDLHRMNAEIAKHGDFKESDFSDYKPHVTVAYVKPEVADQYKGKDAAKGTSFTVTHIAISDKDGNHEEVPLKAREAAGAPAKNGVGALQLAKGQTVHLASGLKGTIQHVNSSMRIARVRTDKGKNLTVRHSMIAAVEDGDGGNSSRQQATTA